MYWENSNFWGNLMKLADSLNTNTWLTWSHIRKKLHKAVLSIKYDILLCYTTQPLIKLFLIHVLLIIKPSILPISVLCPVPITTPRALPDATFVPCATEHQLNHYAHTAAVNATTNQTRCRHIIYKNTETLQFCSRETYLPQNWYMH